MKLRELLYERISLTPFAPEVNNALHKAVMNVFNTQPQTPIQKMDMQFMIKYNTLFVNSIKPILTYYAKQITNTDVTIQFKSLAQGTGQYIEDTNTITIAPKVIANLIKLLFKHYTDSVNTNDIDVIINHLTSVFLHEVTHAKQVSHGQRYEYKHSYVEKDKIKFFTALIQDEFKSEEEQIRAREIYKSQPDEIAAYAQEAASDLISKIHKLSPQEQSTAINVFLKEISKQSHTYSDFKGRSEPGYEKAYRRYLKSIYQTLDDYRARLV
jgi:hypothetical protein